MKKDTRNKRYNAQFDTCIVQKDDIEKILDIHYEIKKNQKYT
jgi:hypothetical protein